jgi:hypothetical protein
VVTRVPRDDRSVLQDAMGLTVEEALALPPLADTTVAAGRHGTTVIIRSSPRHGRRPATSDGERGAEGERAYPSPLAGGG